MKKYSHHKFFVILKIKLFQNFYLKMEYNYFKSGKNAKEKLFVIKLINEFMFINNIIFLYYI